VLLVTLTLRRNACHIMQVSFKHKGEARSLISMMVDAVIAEAQRYVVTPILSRRMDEMGTWYRERMQRDTCGLSMCLGYLLQVRWEATHGNMQGFFLSLLAVAFARSLLALHGGWYLACPRGLSTSPISWIALKPHARPRCDHAVTAPRALSDAAGQIKMVRNQWQMVRVSSTGPCEAEVTFAKNINDSSVLHPFLTNASAQV
jgi:hypothetical protein